MQSMTTCGTQSASSGLALFLQAANQQVEIVSAGVATSAGREWSADVRIVVPAVSGTARTTIET
jgi:hypothetical protein